MLDFHSARQWMSESYGQSESIDKDVVYNDHWAFYMKYNHYMLYVKDDQELTWFKIKYGEEAE